MSWGAYVCGSIAESMSAMGRRSLLAKFFALPRDILQFAYRLGTGGIESRSRVVPCDSRHRFCLGEELAWMQAAIPA